MPLIQKPTEPPQKEQLRIRLEKNIISEMTAYCEWAGISPDYFLEQAATLIFDKDKDWKEKKQNKTVETA